jgi:hypothetical protein
MNYKNSSIGGKKKMKRNVIIVVIAAMFLAVSFSGCVNHVIEGTGTITHIDKKGGFYGLLWDNESGKLAQLDPTNLPLEFKVDGLRVSFKARVASDQLSGHLWGLPVEILEMKLLSPGGTNATGSLVNHTDCKTSQSSDTPPVQDCIEYYYDGQSVLLLKHVNATFNCCPGELLANITIEHNLITIQENESLSECDCVCLYDLDYEIRNLAPGEYTICVNELYVLPGDELLNFTVDLCSTPSGSYCVERNP